MNEHRETVRGLGLPAALPLTVIDSAAGAVASNGYHSFWLNNPPGGDALDKLGAVAPAVPNIWLGVGVIPLASQGPEEITQAVVQNSLPLDRLYLGIGSGSGRGGVERVAAGLRDLRSRLPGANLVAAAMGPRMCRLAGAQADSVLFNWLTPEFARHSTAWVRQGAEEAGHPLPRSMAYVRVALGHEAQVRLQREAATYEAIPHYAAHFRRMGISARDTAITGADRDELQHGLAAWNGVVDEIVVRAITAHETAEEITHLVAAAAP